MIASGDESDSEIRSRYSRQIVLSEIGGEGQKRLQQSRVLVVGAGGLGSPVLRYLCAAGVGHLTVYDHDTVERSNLQRQTLFRTNDLGEYKVDVAVRSLKQLNPNCSLVGKPEKLTEENIEDALENVHLVVEGSDDFDTKFLVNDTCVQTNTPLVIAGILRHKGQVFSILPGTSPCYRCLFESPPPEDQVPDCSEAGVLGPLAGTIGSIQGYEALKILLGFGDPLFHRLIEMDLDQGTFQTVDRYRNPDCPTCSEENPTN